MLAFIFCLLSQFEPTEVKPPTLAEFKAEGLKKLQSQCDAAKIALEKKLPTKKQIASLPRSKSQAIIKQIKADIDAVDARRNDLSEIAIPTFILNRAVPGQLGRPQELVGIADRTTGAIIRTTVKPLAEIVVQKHLSESTLLCRCGARDVVMMNYKGKTLVTGTRLNNMDIYFTTGTYKLGDTVAVAFEKWEHSDAFFAECNDARQILEQIKKDKTAK